MRRVADAAAQDLRRARAVARRGPARPRRRCARCRTPARDRSPRAAPPAPPRDRRRRARRGRARSSAARPGRHQSSSSRLNRSEASSPLASGLSPGWPRRRRRGRVERGRAGRWRGARRARRRLACGGHWAPPPPLGRPRIAEPARPRRRRSAAPRSPPTNPRPRRGSRPRAAWAPAARDGWSTTSTPALTPAGGRGSSRRGASARSGCAATSGVASTAADVRTETCSPSTANRPSSA